MTTTEQRIPLCELAERGRSLYLSRVVAGLTPSDHGKYVAIDVETGSYEVDTDDSVAVDRLRVTNPVAQVWVERAGHAAAEKLRHLS